MKQTNCIISLAKQFSTTAAVAVFFTWIDASKIA